MTNQRPRIDYTSSDYDSLRTAMLELASERLPEWTDHSPNDIGVTLVELFAAMLDANFYALDRVANESYLETAQERRSIVNLLRLIGYELRQPLPAYAGMTLLFDVAGQPQNPPWLVTIPRGTRFATTAKATGTVIGFRYMRPDLSINVGLLPQQAIAGKTYYVFETLPVVQVDQTLVNEVLGSSDGSPRQRFPLAKKSMIDGTLEIRVSSVAWDQKDTLLYSDNDDQHFTVRRDENDVVWIEFGDGVRGQPPARGQSNVLASYCVGGGAKGNVPARTITEIVTQITGLTKVFNDKPGNRGTEHEAIADAVVRAPQQYRSMGRAVTASDYETHALMFGAAKARATATGNRVDLMIAPAGGGLPSDILKDDLRAYLESKRMLTTKLNLVDPKYIPFRIQIKLTVDTHYYRLEVKTRVQAVVREIWAFDRVKFGEVLYVSKIYEAIEAVEGVEGVTVTDFSLDGGPHAVNGVLVLNDDQLPSYAGLLDADIIELNGGKI